MLFLVGYVQVRVIVDLVRPVSLIVTGSQRRTAGPASPPLEKGARREKRRRDCRRDARREIRNRSPRTALNNRMLAPRSASAYRPRVGLGIALGALAERAEEQARSSEEANPAAHHPKQTQAAYPKSRPFSLPSTLPYFSKTTGLESKFPSFRTATSPRHTVLHRPAHLILNHLSHPH